MTTTHQGRPAAHAAGLPASLPVASYARRSKRATGDGKGAFINIGDQHAQNRAYAAEAFPGAPVVEYDDNISAWDPDVYRENWERLLEDTRAGRVRAVIGRYADRLTRQPEQGEALLTACKRSRAELHTTSGGHITSALMFRIELALAAEESDQKSRRMTDKHRTLGAAGAFSGGRRRFGYTEDMSAIVPREADAINDAMTAILNGESVASVTRRWNAAGILTTGGKAHTSNNVAKMLKRRYLAGVREYKGQEYPAAWPAIVDDTTHAAVCRVLAKNSAAGNGFTGTRKYALSGVLLCGVCGGRMYGRPTPLKSGPAYVCRTGQHTQAPVRDVDGTVRAVIVRRLSNVNAAGVFVHEIDREAAEARQAERETLAGRLDELGDALAEGVSPSTIARAEARIAARLAELAAEDAAEADAVSRPQRVLEGLAGLPVEDTAAAFDALPADRQRAVINVLGVPSLDRGGRGGRGVFNPRRVRFAWLDDAPGDA